MTALDAAPAWVADVVPDGLVDLHTHFLPPSVLLKVWAYFDAAAENYGRDWPVQYKLPEAERVAVLHRLGVTTYAPLVYAHKPGMAAWLNDWVLEFAAHAPGALPTATFYPEPGVEEYLAAALARGARVVKVHVQVGRFDPRDPLLDKAWGLLAEAGVPVVTHCGNGPLRGEHTGIGVFEQVMRRHPRLTAVLAHAGLPEYGAALDLVRAYPRVHLDTTMVGTAYTEDFAPLPPDWPARLVDVADRVILGSDFPNIPYPYADQLEAIGRWAAAHPGLGDRFLRAVLRETPARLVGLDLA